MPKSHDRPLCAYSTSQEICTRFCCGCGLAWFSWPRCGLQWIGSNAVVLLAMPGTFTLEVTELAARARLPTAQVSIQVNCDVLLITDNFYDKYIPTSAQVDFIGIMILLHSIKILRYLTIVSEELCHGNNSLNSHCL